MAPGIHSKYYQKTYQVIPFYFLNSISNLVLDHASIEFIFHIYYKDEEITSQNVEIDHAKEMHEELDTIVKESD